MSYIVDTGKQVIVRFTQGCAEVGCTRTWSITRARMLQTSKSKWGNTLCRRHGSIFFGAGRPPLAGGNNGA